MNRLAATVFICAPCLLSAQQIALPPSSVQEGVIIYSAAVNSGSSYWGSRSSLGAYRVSGDGYQSPLQPGAADSQLGLVWKTTAPVSFGSARQTINNQGGIMRVIFLGETAGWLNDFGYTYSGNPTGPGSYTAWTDIQSNGCDRNITFGDHFDLSLAAGEMEGLDLWFKASGSWQKNRCGSNYTGGLYTLFNSPGADGGPSQFLWADRSINVNTWNPLLNDSALIDTYLISLEDWRLDRGADDDYNDFRFALQLLNADSTALANIPEPREYAAFFGLAVLTWAFLQKRRQVLHG